MPPERGVTSTLTMKIAVAFVALATGASAFAPSSKSARTAELKASAELDGLLGPSVETGNKIFDPVGLAEYLPADWGRKGELSNGRSAMLATVGWIVPKYYMFPSDDVSTSDPIKAILEADPQWWAQFLLFCGTIEAVKFRGELDGKSYTGEGEPVIDYLNGWSGLSDAEKEAMRMKELKNGRLAMLGIASFVSNYFIPGSVPLLPEGF